jgi:HSP20 family molecular chaperone IbpA
MSANQSRDWMWAEACELLDRAERLHRQFFQPMPARSAQWQPPVDIFETERALWIMVALPGVVPEQVEMVIQGGVLIVAGTRALPHQARGAAIRRLEIPSGRFERHIELPPGSFEVIERSFANGCLLLGLAKLGRERGTP